MILTPAKYIEFPEFNPYNKKYREQSIKKYLMFSYLSKFAYDEREGGWDLIERKLTTYYGFTGFKSFDNPKGFKYKTKDGGTKTIKAQGYAVWNDNVWVSVYCGTNDLSDWFKNNLDIDRIQAPWGGKMQEGDWEYMDTLRPQMEECRLKHGKDKLICTDGHSLGGAGAFLYGSWLDHTGVNIHNIWTQGQPPVVDKEGAAILSQRIGHKYYRCEFGVDLVPKMSEVLWDHPKNIHIYIRPSGKFKGNKRRRWINFWTRMAAIRKFRMIRIGIDHHDIQDGGTYIGKVQSANKVYL